MLIFIDLCGVTPSFFKMKIPNSLALRAYSKYFVENLINYHLEFEMMIFRPPYLDYRDYRDTEQLVSVNHNYLIEDLIENQCKFYKARESISNFLKKMIIFKLAPR